MRIQSRFKDYYDFISHRFGADPNCIYVREPIGKPGTIVFTIDACGTEDGFKNEIEYKHRDKYDMRFIVVGPRVFPFVHDRMNDDMCRLTDEGGAGIDRLLAYDYKTKRPSYPDPIPLPKLANLVRAVGAPVFEVREAVSEWSSKRSANRRCKMLLEISAQIPVLAALGFPSFLPAQDAWQEIYTTLTSVLRKDPDKEVPVTLKNSDRIEKAGFDLKSSFRHPVNEKRVRR